MANEIANIAQAGIVLQVFEDPFEDGIAQPPLIMGSWGVVEASLEAVSTDGGGANTGEYRVRLVRPGAGTPAILGAESTVINGYSSLSQSLQWSGYLQDEEFNPDDRTPGGWICELVVDPDGPAPVVGKTISLPILKMQQWGEGPQAETGFINCQVFQIPQG